MIIFLLSKIIVTAESFDYVVARSDMLWHVQAESSELGRGFNFIS
jgi:hypothetical protein